LVEDDRSYSQRAHDPATEATSTREALIELAADLFAEHGYIQTSIRDIARRGALTSGAIYGNFRNKADLLAAAINKRTRQQLESEPVIGSGTSHVDALRLLSQAYPRRQQLRALILQGAAAAKTDAETRNRLREEQLAHLDTWIAGYEQHRERLGIDPSVDVRTAVLYTWAAELGLGILEALGIEPTSTDDWADMAARCGRAMTLPAEAPTEHSPGKPSKPAARKRPAKR
jgi:AcrR family transcriptional regulator